MKNRRRSNRLKAPADEPGSFRGSFDFPATATSFAQRYEVFLPAAAVATVRPLAAERFGMELEEFARAFLGGGLPRQQEHRKTALPDGPPPALDFVPEHMVRRLQRVAKMTETSLRDLVVHNLETAVEMYERDMIFDPNTGEIVADAGSDAFQGLQNPVALHATGRPLKPQPAEHGSSAERKGGA